jgi:small subunit ribosomal protein S2
LRESISVAPFCVPGFLLLGEAEHAIQEVEKMSEKTELEKSGMPVKQETFLEAGVHIGTKIRTSDMRDFIFKRRDDGLYILDLRISSERLLTAAKLMAKYSPEDVAVVASRVYSSNPAKKFADLTGIRLIRGRFVPGTMTNMTCKGFLEPKLLFVCDPKGEREALVEGARNGVTVIALCDTDNETKFIDLVIPINNKGKRSLALVFYILAREVMMSQGKIKSYDEFPYEINHFEQLVIEEKKPEEEATEASVQEEEGKPEEEKPKEPAKEKETKEEKPQEEEAPKEKKPAKKEEAPKEKESEKKKPPKKEAPKEKKPAEAKEEPEKKKKKKK